MEILSHIIARTCCLNLKSSEFLYTSTDFNIALDEAIDGIDSFNLQKNTILNKLHEYNLNIKEKSVNNAIQNTRRNIFNDKKVKEKDLVKITTLPQLKAGVEQFIAILESSNQTQNLKRLYEKEFHKKRHNLYQLIQNPLLKNGLVLSSTDLLSAIDKPILELVGRYNKKSKQIEVGILKYLTRSSFKPTPFSSFTQLTDVKTRTTEDRSRFIKFEKKKEVKNSVRINNYIFKQLKVILLNNEDIYFHLPVALNPSIKYDENKNLFKFLINKDNFEFFRDLTANDVIQLLIEYIDAQNCTFKDVVDFCNNQIDATKEEIKKYIKDLISIGLFEYKVHASGTDIDWISKLQCQIKSIPESTVRVKILELLTHLESFRLKFEESFTNVNKRLVILNETYEVFNREYGNLYHDIFPKTKEVKEELSFIWKERIFFEDTTNQSEVEINSTLLKPFIVLADDLIKYSFLVAPKTFKQKELFDFFKHTYNKQSISLLNVYEQYYKHLKKEKSEVKSNKENSENRSKVVFEAPINDLNDFVIDINEDIVNFKIKKSVSLPEIPKNYSSSMFFQLIEGNDGKKKVVVNGLGYGYGQMSSRFLGLFDDDFTAEIRAKNKRLGGNNSLYAEVNDASYFNANLHPPLFDYECKIPGGHTNVAIDMQLNVNNLNVRLNEENQDLELIDKKTGKQVFVQDSCFQGTKGRSELFSLLLNFGNNVIPYHRRVLNKINNAHNKKISDNIFEYPRIVYNQDIILQRKYWLVINTDALVMSSNESELDYMLRIVLWKENYNIPDRVYVTLNYMDNSIKENTFRRDDYKPQYIDFKNPIFIPLIAKLFKKVQSYKLSEALPTIKDAIEISKNDNRTIEFLTQWYNGKNF